MIIGVVYKYLKMYKFGDWWSTNIDSESLKYRTIDIQYKVYNYKANVEI